MVAAKVGPAVATGNTVILKPSEKNCLSTIYCGKLFKEAGFPPGVVNIVIGDGSTGALLSSHPDINKARNISTSTNCGRLHSRGVSRRE